MKVARVFGNVLEILGGILVSPGSGECIPSVDAPLQARETLGSLWRVVGCCHLSGL